MGAIDTLLQLAEERLGSEIRNLDPDTFVELFDDETLNLFYDLLAHEDEATRYGRFAALFPEEGPFRRELYPKHSEFFAAGRWFTERLFMAANRVGKTVAGGFETTTHLTGQYRPWWEGRRFRRPIRAWAAGDTNETTRDIIQKELLGEVTYAGHRKTLDGSGIVPRDCIGDVTWKQGVPNLVDTVDILHKTGGWSQLGFKSYDQGRRVFQGTAKELIWLDEECPVDVYEECLIRLMTTRGLMITTFTPLLGMSKVVRSFLPDTLATPG